MYGLRNNAGVPSAEFTSLDSGVKTLPRLWGNPGAPGYRSTSKALR
jgi:hypothetical protein